MISTIFLISTVIDSNYFKDLTLSINPILSFKSIKKQLTKDINENLKKFKSPTPIQSVSWPLLLEGKDLVGVAKTGMLKIKVPLP